MRITFILCNVLSVSQPRFCFKPSKKYILQTLSIIMTQRANNTNFSKLEYNPHHNGRHRGVGSSCSVPLVHNKRNSKKGYEFKESITDRHVLNTNACINPIHNFKINPFALPITHSHQRMNSSCSSIYNAHFNCMSFRSGGNKSAEKNTMPTNSEGRTWKTTKLGSMISPPCNNKYPGVFFSIMNYNVLAQDLLLQHPEIYVRHKENSLDWKFRFHNLFNEISEHNCDILCLQEVQGSHLLNYYNKLKTIGYESIYKQRTGDKTDGCSIYYKTNVFKLIEYITVEYLQPNISILNRDNIGIIAKFAPLNNLSAEFIVATTHLLYNPRREDVRLAQSQVLLTEVERMAFDYNKNDYLPIIITGDLNSTPDTSIYDFMTNGSTNYTKTLKPKKRMWISNQLSINDNCQHVDLLNYRERNVQLNRDEEYKLIKLQHSEKKIMKTNTTDCNSEFNTTSACISHNFNLKSVYEENSHLEGTTYQNEWVVVDYIFYSGKRQGRKLLDNSLKLLSYYTLPRGNALNSLIIPNEQLGSDHLSLVAKFKLEYK